MAFGTAKIDRCCFYAVLIFMLALCAYSRINPVKALAADTAEKLEVPSDDSQTSAQKVIAELYHDQYRQAKRPEEKTALRKTCPSRNRYLR